MKRRKAIPAPPTRRAATFPIVGIGASAGGLDAFKKFFTALPGDTGVAFVLIQHLDPTRSSLTADLVGTYTSMRVVQARDRTKVAANCVYVIPPNTYLSIQNRTLRVSVPTESRSLRMAIDFFLCSLAQDQHERAIGIVLSGTGTDGTLGLKEIKAAGGMTMVQDPPSAQHDGMPRSAIAADCADHVLAAEQMPATLVAYVRHTTVVKPRIEAPAGVAPDPLASALALLRARTKFDFGGYKSGTLRRRIQRRMSLRHVASLPQYVELLRADPTEATALVKDFLINVTSFFREPLAWKTLQERVIRPLLAQKDEHAPLRAWVPACSSGEEAYSLAMVLIEEMQATGKACQVQVFASDVDTEALEAARAGVYPEGIAAHVPPERLAHFFVKQDDHYRASKELRDTVTFAQQSLISDPPFSRLDLITCRNLFIYLEPTVQERLIPLLHFALVSGGYLFLGSAEGIGPAEDLFEPVSAKWRIYRRIGPTRHDKVRFPIAASPFSTLGPERAAAPSKSGRVAALAQHLLLQRYAPACVVITRAGEIRYFHGRTEDYLAQPTGLPTQDLVAQARNALRSKLRSAVQDALRSEQAVIVAGIQMRRGSTLARVKITVEPLSPGKIDSDGLWLVSFADAPESATIATPIADVSSADIALVHQLEDELKTTKEDLQQFIEDLRASNEELMSVNEELQSSNEELETSKEELQSLNEELTTANLQLESKIQELEATNNDLDNLLTSTNIATLFLDTKLYIRQFTPAATKLFTLIPSDIGRPISDIAQRFTDPSLLADAAAVLRRPSAPKREVQAQDGRWYVRQVLPYRTRDHRTDGVVITLSDVAAEALHEARLYAEAIVDTVREPLLVLDKQFRVVSANRSYYAAFGGGAEGTAGRLLYELGEGQWDIPLLRRLLAELLAKKRALNDFEVRCELPGLGPRVLLINARALQRKGVRPELILLAFEDLTERLQAQETLRESAAREHAEDQVRQRQAELAHALRISTIGELASGLAHELNQPLSSIANGVEACARYVRSNKVKPAQLLSLLDEASAEALRAAEIVEHLRGFIEKGTPQFKVTDLREIANGIPRLLRREIEQAQVSLRPDIASRPLPILADRIQIEQVLVNLMQNALDAVRDRTTHRLVQLQARVVKRVVEVVVRDSGGGVSAEVAERMFEPFFTTKAHGLGMGLAISRSIIEAHHGRIWMARPADGKSGTAVHFTLPLHTATPARRRRTT